MGSVGRGISFSVQLSNRKVSLFRDMHITVALFRLLFKKLHVFFKDKIISFQITLGKLGGSKKCFYFHPSYAFNF